MTAKKSDKDATASLSFEEAMAKLEQVVSNLEGGELGLETSLAAFEEGMKLAKTCEDKLNEASGRVEKIIKDFGGDKGAALSVATDDDEPKEDDDDIIKF